MTHIEQCDIDALRELLDMMTDFSSNDQRARYLLGCNWMRERGATAASNAQAELDRIFQASPEMLDEIDCRR